MRRGAGLVRPARFVIDVGCGIRPQTLVVPEHQLCVEPFSDYCTVLRDKLAGVTASIVNAQVPGFLENLPSSSTDTVFLLDVIEHLDRAAGLRTLEECVRVSRSQVVVFTPLGFMIQDHAEDSQDGWGMKGMHWQTHRSGWTPDDFLEGWRVVACKEFHLINGAGVRFDPPFGAMWAVYDHAMTSEPRPRTWTAEIARYLAFLRRHSAV